MGVDVLVIEHNGGTIVVEGKGEAELHSLSPKDCANYFKNTNKNSRSLNLIETDINNAIEYVKTHQGKNSLAYESLVKIKDAKC